LFFSDRGKVYSEKVYQIPDANRTDRGIPMVNLLSLENGEKITAAVAAPGFDASAYCTLATTGGRVKRLPLSEFNSVRPSGLIAMGLDTGDELGWARLTSGKDDIILVTAQGQALRCDENDFRPMGRQAAGVRGIRLASGDRVASMEVASPKGYLLVVTEKGFGKRTALSEYIPKGRATHGVATIDQKNLSRSGLIAGARVVEDGDEITLITKGGVVLRLKISGISTNGRVTRGSRLMKVGASDSIASLARLPGD
jgi:DNA gyrase subunit A